MKTMQIILLFLIILELGFLCYLGVKMNRENPVTSERPPLEDFTNTIQQHYDFQYSIAGWQTTPDGCFVIVKESYNGKEYYSGIQFVKVESEYGTDWYLRDLTAYHKVQN